MSLLIQNLNYHIHNKAILSNIGFEIPGRKLIAILGPNGSGKTHLLKSILGLIKPSQATQIYYRGADFVKLSTVDKSKYISWLPQNPEFSFEYTVRQMLDLGLFVEADRAQALQFREDFLEFFSLKALLERSLSSLSGGELKLFFALRAVARSCPLILMDEPDAGLDIKYKLKLHLYLKNMIQNHHKTILICMHDVALAAQFSDYLILLNEGRLAYAGGNKSEWPRAIEHVYDVQLEDSFFRSYQKMLT